MLDSYAFFVGCINNGFACMRAWTVCSCMRVYVTVFAYVYKCVCICVELCTCVHVYYMI